jgi:hypothetical protein
METSPATSTTTSGGEAVTVTVTVNNTVTVTVTTQKASSIPFIGLPETLLAILLGFLVAGIIRRKKKQ